MTQADENQEWCDRAAECWFLTGATASGKTDISIEMAKLLDAEIISLDSMAIYRQMDIGTAKPTIEIRQQIPHHMIDIVNPTDSFSVSQYREQAMVAIESIRGRGRQVIFVGGTALYLKALLRGLFDGPPADWEFREMVQKEIDDMGGDFLHQRLAMIDPISAHQLHPNDHRRIIRAMEVFRTTGKPISHWQMQFDEPRDPDQCKVFSVRHPRPELHRRIEQRVELMFEHGLIDEVQLLIQSYTQLGRTASQAVGYREVIEHIENDTDLNETIERVKVRTRRFARHQETWFRGLDECRMVDVPTDSDPRELAQRLIDLGQEVPLSN